MAANDIVKNPKWQKQEKALKKIQINFELTQTIDRTIRMEAAKTGDSPSNVVRKVLGLEASAPVRPRLGVSLSNDELATLAQRYNVDPADRKALVRKTTEAIQQHFLDSENK